MAAVLNAGPALEPVTLAQAKAYLRVDSADEDDLILSLITAARISAELQINRLLIELECSRSVSYSYRSLLGGLLRFLLPAISGPMRRVWALSA